MSTLAAAIVESARRLLGGGSASQASATLSAPEADPSPSPSATQAGARRMRETAKWLATVFGALGTVLVGSLSLAGLAERESDELETALLGYALALVGTVGIVASLAQVLRASIVSLHELYGASRDRYLADFVERHPELLKGFLSVEELATRHRAAQRSHVVAHEAFIDSGGKPELASAVELARKDLKMTSGVVDTVCEYAAFDRLQRRFRWGQLGALAGFVTAAVGLAVFARTAAPPSPPESAAALRPRPAMAVLDLNPRGTQLYQQMLGERCDLDHLVAVVVDNDNDVIDAVVLRGDGCALRRLEIPTSVASVCPLRRAQTGPAGPARGPPC